MLKWAVNGTRQTYLPSVDLQLHVMPSRVTATSTTSTTSATTTHPTQAQRRRLKRKSSDACMMRAKHPWCDKENQFTSTPLPPTSRSFSESPSRKMDSLRDLSNIVPDLTPFNSPLPKMPGFLQDLTSFQSPLIKKSPAPVIQKSSSPTPLKTPAKTPKPSSPCKRPASSKPTNPYASTLPTFDVEYSPCALIPGPLLALRGIGIPDSYFEKPRYLTPHLQQQQQQQQLTTANDSPPELCLETKTFIKPKDFYPAAAFMEDSSLSSSKMGDTTLERMIDAILESTRKERKPKNHQQQQREKPLGLNMSPTYTPADDPASDLHEVWDSEELCYRQRDLKFRARLTKKCLFNEREIKSPQATAGQKLKDPGQLRRQGGVRRKRKITKLKASVMSSAQKLLGKAALQTTTPLLHSHNLRKVFEAERIQDEVHPKKLLRSNLSPDSGHNSSSGYDEDDEREVDGEMNGNDEEDGNGEVDGNADGEGDADEDLTLGNKSEEYIDKTLDVTKRRLSFSLPHSSES